MVGLPAAEAAEASQATTFRVDIPLSDSLPKLKIGVQSSSQSSTVATNWRESFFGLSEARRGVTVAGHQFQDDGQQPDVKDWLLCVTDIHHSTLAV